MSKKSTFSGAMIGVAAAALAAAGGYYARAETGAVNAPGAPVTAAPQSFADVVQRVAPAVVSIDVVGKASVGPVSMQGFSFRFGPNGPQIAPGDPGGQAEQAPMHASGSGFFIRPDGYVLTNNHVIDGAEKITVVTKDGRRLDAHLVGADPATDLAVLKVAGEGFPFVSFEDQAQPRVGDWVVAVGNPLGLGGTATAGIVSALGRQNVSDSSYVDYMQIDAPINHGNSGGPTFDVYGRVVGVNTAIFSTSGGSMGIGFDIPADVAQSVSRQLIASGKVVRGYIGATIQNVTPDIADSLGIPGGKGALVAQVTPGGPSATAGLLSGDLVQQIDGRPVTSATDLTRQVALAQPGAVIHLGILRNGRHEDIDLRSGVRPNEASLASNGQTPDLGGAPNNAAPAAVLGMQLEPNPSGGVTIDGVSPSSDAGEKGLSGGDVILSAGGRPVATPAEVAGAVAAAKSAGRKDVLVLVDHGGHKLYVPIEVAKG